jgi:hypothetical protein
MAAENRRPAGGRKQKDFDFGAVALKIWRFPPKMIKGGRMKQIVSRYEINSINSRSFFCSL